MKIKEHDNELTPDANHYDWVAQIAQMLPGAVFEDGPTKRDGKCRINVYYNNKVAEGCIVGKDRPTEIAARLKSTWKPYSPPECDLCEEPATWYHDEGGFRCDACDHPEHD